MTQQEMACYPPNCVDFSPVGWLNQPLAVPKFDPTQGNLVRVEVAIESDFQGTMCYDNDNPTFCCDDTLLLTFGYTYNGLFTLQSSATNMPPIQLGPITYTNSVANSNIFLAPDDGDGPNIDCSGVPSCNPGGDSGTDVFANTDAPAPVVFRSMADLRAFTLCPSEPANVTFLSSASDSLTTTGCLVQTSPDADRRIRLIVTYFYCDNAPPVCAEDSAQTMENMFVDIDVLANDFDPEDRIACDQIEIVDPPMNGTVMPVGCTAPPDTACPPGPSDCTGCVLRYTPTIDTCGPDSFTYRIHDLDGGVSDACLVTIDVQPVNEPPVAVDDMATTPEDTPVLVPVCDNDMDPDAAKGCGEDIDCCTVTVTSEPDCGGTTSTDPTVCDGVTFTPPPGFCGTCTFRYRVRDAGGLVSNEATVTVEVTGVNDCPVAVDDMAQTMEDTPVQIPVCDNDMDPDLPGCGSPIDCCTVTVTVPPDCGGTTTASCDGIRFTPPQDFCGTCTFQYTVADGAGCVSNPATVTVEVTGVNDCPVANDDTATTPEDTPIQIPVCDNDTDPDAAGCGEPIDCCTVTVTMESDCGGTTQAGCNGILFTPPPGFCGTCRLRYRVSDGAGCTSNEAVVTIEVTPVNDCPIANPDTDTTVEGMPVTVDVCSNDTDPDQGNGCGNPIDCCTVMVVTPPDCGGTTSVSCDGVTFTPPAGFCGDCTFTYTVSDGLCVSNPALVTITVIGENECPTANNDTATTPEDTPITIPVCDNDTDPDQGTGCGEDIDCCTVTVVTEPSCGGSTTTTCGGVRFTPPADFCGTCTFTYTVSDGVCVSNLATVTVTVLPQNDPPIAQDDTGNTQENTPLVMDLCANDSDPDGPSGCGAPIDCTTIIVTTQPDCGGTATPNGDGTVTFVPPPDLCGIDCHFTYRVFDTDGLFDDANVTVSVKCGVCITPNRRKPASLLIYPEFDNREGIVSILNLTNRAQNGPDIRAKFVYREEGDCSKFDRSEDLTPNDTLTLITNYHNPVMERGYVYVYAECATGGVPVVYNNLIGNLLVVDGLQTFAFAVNPIAFEGVGMGAPPAPGCNGLLKTDVDGDGIRDLNGIEYVEAPDEILVPRFMGQTADRRSELIFIGLTGVAFQTTVDFLIYDDNEHAFSREYTFGCWARVPLLEISNAFSQQFLENLPDTDPEEILGEPTTEAGWFRMNGALAQSTNTTIEDPAFYAVLVESVGDDRYVGDLPFERCTQDNGDLLPNGLAGDTHD